MTYTKKQIIEAMAEALREAAVVIGQQATVAGSCCEGCHKSDAIVLEIRARRIEQEGDE